MPGAEHAQSPEAVGVCITEALITKRNLTFPEDEDLSEKMFHTIAELETVRLDREKITTIKNLEGLQNVHSLYLQVNKIQRIENLDCIPSLRFLSLAGNQIRKVENLLSLQYLQFLDLSDNLIETLNLDELPESLLILNLLGNPCTNQDGYRKMVIGALPLLLDLDRQPVLERWVSDEEDEASGDEDEFPELSGPFCSERGFFKELRQELKGHQERRQQAALAEHLERMEMKPTLTSLPQIPGMPMAGDSSSSVTPEPRTESAPKTTSSSQVSSPTKNPCTLVPKGQKHSVQPRKGVPEASASKASLVVAPSTSKTSTKKIKN